VTGIKNDCWQRFLTVVIRFCCCKSLVPYRGDHGCNKVKQNNGNSKDRQ